MAKLEYKNGVTSVVLRVKVMDSTSQTGGAKTGLLFSSAGLIISTIADNEATATAYTQAGSTIETITTLGTFASPTSTKCRFKEVDSTNHPGLYEIQIADARWSVSNARSVVVTVTGATGAAQVDAEVQLMTDDPYTAKPSNYASLSIDGSGRVDVGKLLGTASQGAAGYVARDMAQVVLTSPTAGTAGEAELMMLNRLGRRATAQAGSSTTITLDSGASATDNIYATHSIKIISGTGVGQVATITGYVGATKVATINRPGGGTWSTNPDNTSVFQIEAVPAANVAFFLFALITGTAANIVAAFTKFFDKASPTGTVNSLPDAVAGASSGLAIVGSNVGQATSVSGAVGSVAGNVGGSVASVTARVTANTDQFAGQTITAAAPVTVPSSIASPTNLTGGTVTTATNLTNAPTAGDFTAAMKTSLNQATPTVVLSTTDEAVMASLNAMIAANKFTVSALSNGPTGGSAPTTAQIAAAILQTPANLLLTDSSGRVTVGSNADKSGYALSVTPPTSAQNAAALLASTLTQRNVTALSTSTVEDALSAARAQGAGSWSFVGTTLILKNPDGTTFRTFTLDSAAAPTSRT